MHGVEQGTGDLLRPVTGRKQDAQRQADQQTEEQGGQHQRERHHRFRPDAQQGDSKQSHGTEEGDAPPGELPGNEEDDADHRQNRDTAQALFDPGERAVNRRTQHLEKGAEILHDPAQALVDPVLDRQLAVVEKAIKGKGLIADRRFRAVEPFCRTVGGGSIPGGGGVVGCRRGVLHRRGFGG